MTRGGEEDAIPQPDEHADAVRRRSRALGALLFYAVAVVWLTWPLGRHVATDLPFTGRACRFDSLLIGWALAHESDALTAAPSTLLHGNVYHPSRHGLLYGEAGFGALPYFLPAYLLTGNPTLALNVTYLVSVTLTAWALYLVVSWWTGSMLASLLAGWTFLMTRWVLWTWVPCAPNYAVLQYLPLIAALAAVPIRRWSQTVRLALLVALQCLTSVYVAAATFAPLGVLALVRLARRGARAPGAKLLVALALALLVIAPIYGTYLLVRMENPDIARQSVWHGLPQITPLPWGPLGRGKPTAVPIAALVVIVLGAASLLAGAWRTLSDTRRRAWANAALWLGVGLLLSLGLMVSWEGSRFSTPLGLLATWIPLYEVIRVPYRFGIAALIGLCLLTGLAFAELLRRLPSSALTRWGIMPVAALVCAGLMYAEYHHGIGPVNVDAPAKLPDSYPLQRPVEGDSLLDEAIARSDGPLLELPAPVSGGRPVSPPQAVAMYRSISHRRPILNGYSGYWPAGFLERLALARRLPDHDALAALVSTTGLETILVHTDRLPRDERRRWMALASESDGSLVLLARGARGELAFEVVKPDSTAPVPAHVPTE